MTTLDLSGWMSQLADDLPLSSITIPGTHDSSTFLADSGEGAGFVKTQTLDFGGQLAAGCRFFDIRCFVTAQNQLELCHANFPMGDDFQTALDVFSSFLNDNPKETILMSVKEDAANQGTVVFSSVFDTYYQANETLFNKSNIIPKLGETRGQVVLLRRFDDPQGEKGLDFPFSDNTSFQNAMDENSSQYLFGEDVYNPKTISYKQSAIQNNLNRALYDNDANHLYATFTSGYVDSAEPPEVDTPLDLSQEINPWLSDFLSRVDSRSPLGIIAMDFVESVDVPLLLSFSDTNVPQLELKQVIGTSTSYFPSGGLGETSTYVDTDVISAPEGQVVLGFHLILAGNRIFPRVLFGDMGGTNQHWETPQSNSNNYFPKGGASGIGDKGDKTMYMDSNLVLAPAGEVVVGIGLYQKGTENFPNGSNDNPNGNRVAIKLNCAPASDLSNTHWVESDNVSSESGYFDGDYNLSPLYVESNDLVADPGFVVVGLAFMQGGANWTYDNRISYQILTAPTSSF